MIVLELSKKLQKFIGVYRESTATRNEVLYMWVMNVVYVFGMFSILTVGSIVFIFMNYTNIEKVTNSVVVMMAGNELSSKYVH